VSYVQESGRADGPGAPADSYILTFEEDIVNTGNDLEEKWLKTESIEVPRYPPIHHTLSRSTHGALRLHSLHLGYV
jgi:superfamily II DNA helicase RecQ